MQLLPCSDKHDHTDQKHGRSCLLGMLGATDITQDMVQNYLHLVADVLFILMVLAKHFR